MIKSFYKLLPIVYLSIFISACSTLQETKSTPTTVSKKARVDQLTHWQLSGAIAAKQNKKAWSATITWEQSGPQKYYIHLSGPMGGNAVTIEKDHGVITYQDGQQIQKSSNESKLLHQKTGQALPLSHLYYWVRGVKSPGPAKEVKNASGELIELKQAGYTLHYSQYQWFDDYYLPTKIQINHSNHLVKLVIRSWKGQR